MPRINPEILRWARETAGFELAEAAVRIALGPARGVEAAQRLAALESGEAEPTRPLLVKMAKQSGVKQKIPIANPHMVAADFDRAIRLAPGEPSVYRAFIGSVPAGESDEEFAAAVEAHPSTPQVLDNS